MGHDRLQSDKDIGEFSDQRKQCLGSRLGLRAQCRYGLSFLALLYFGPGDFHEGSCLRVPSAVVATGS